MHNLFFLGSLSFTLTLALYLSFFHLDDGSEDKGLCYRFKQRGSSKEQAETNHSTKWALSLSALLMESEQTDLNGIYRWCGSDSCKYTIAHESTIVTTAECQLEGIRFEIGSEILLHEALFFILRRHRSVNFQSFEFLENHLSCFSCSMLSPLVEIKTTEPVILGQGHWITLEKLHYFDINGVKRPWERCVRKNTAAPLADGRWHG